MKLHAAAALAALTVHAVSAGSMVDVLPTTGAGGAEDALKMADLAVDLDGSPVAARNLVAANIDLDSPQARRNLQQHNLNTDFAPLPCNLEGTPSLDSIVDGCTGYATTAAWSSVVKARGAGPTTIPCGTCVVLDAAAGTEAAPTVIDTDGLNVEGKLVVPAAASHVEIRTDHVYVQGVLQVQSDPTRPISPSQNQVRFVMTGTTDLALVPNAANADRCPAGVGCPVGKKPFVVAGGRLDVDAMPAACPAWTSLLDVQDVVPPPPTETSPEMTPFVNPDPACAERVVISHDFDDGSASGWTGNWGAQAEVTPEGTLKVTNRTLQWEQGPMYDFIKCSYQSCLVPDQHKSCLVKDQKYLFSARIRLSRPDGAPSLCSLRNATSFNKCPRLKHMVRYHRDDGSEREDHRVNAKMREYDAVPDGEWALVSWEVKLNAREADPENIFFVFLIDGPEAGTDIEIDDVTFELPPLSNYPDLTSPDVCDNLVLGAASPENTMSVHPFRRYGADSLRILTETKADGTANAFYRLGDRYKHDGSMIFFVEPGCLTFGSLYEFSMKWRLNSPTVIDNAYIELLAHYPGGGHDWYHMQTGITLGGGTGDADNWKEIRFGYTIPEKLAGASKVEVWFRTKSSPEFVDEFGRNRYAEVDYDDISFTRLHGAITKIAVDGGAGECWGVGSEVVVTSHTTYHNDEQVRTITSVTPPAGGTGPAILELDSAILDPTTAAADPDAPCEVALLSRNVVLEGEPTGGVAIDGVDKNNDGTMDSWNDQIHGGHLMVLGTPEVNQTLSGVELRHFGQQGINYRFPIHFHLSRSVLGSKVSKNLIRDSYQRGVVLQGTDGLTVSENVAYNIRGHTFMLRDGGEVDNVFERNLAIRTKKIKDSNRYTTDDSDDYPAAFLISNAQNTYVGNVVAGSESNGYWYELRRYVRGLTAERWAAEGIKNGRDARKKDPIKEFRDNVVHSADSTGFRLHRDGYYPATEQTFVGLKAYKNKYAVYLEWSRNIAFQGLYAADNKVSSVEIRNPNNVRISDSTIKGSTDQYKQTVATQTHLGYRCDNKNNYITGVRLRYYQDDIRWWVPGHRIENTHFADFGDTGCIRSVGVRLDTGHRTMPHWDNFLQTTGVTLDESTTLWDGCTAEAVAVNDVLIYDNGSSLGDGAGPGAIVGPVTKTFAAWAGGTCQDNEAWCYSYCDNVCLRTVKFITSAYDTEDVKLMITDNDDPTKEPIKVGGNFRFHTGSGYGGANIYENTKDYKTRTYAASLPAGNFTAQFVNALDEPVWPTFARRVYEPAPACGGGLEEGAIELAPPPVTELDCQELIKNGDAERHNYTHWSHTSGGVMTENGTGIDGSFAIVSTSRNDVYDQIAQYIDSRCIKANVGREFEVTAQFKMELDDGVHVCDPNNYDYGPGCPRVFLYMRKESGAVGSTQQYVTGERQNVAKGKWPVDQTGGYSLIQGTITIDEQMAEYDSFLFGIGRTKSHAKIFLDNVSFHPLRSTEEIAVRSSQSAPEIIKNGDFEESDYALHWDSRPYHRSAIKLVEGKDAVGTALMSYNRAERYSGPAQWLDPTDITEGVEYEVSVSYKLSKEGMGDIVCIPGESGMYECPEVTIYARAEPSGYDDEYDHVGFVTSPGDANDPWGTIKGRFVANQNLGNAQYMFIFVQYVSPGVDITIDKVSLKEYIVDCSNLIRNGNFPENDFNHWEPEGGGVSLEMVTDSYSTGYALKATGRTSRSHGMKQEFHPSCVHEGDLWSISAKVKLEQNGATVECDRAVTVGGCPKIKIRTRSIPEWTEREVATVIGVHDADGWFNVSGVFEMYDYNEEATDGVVLYFRGPDVGVDLIVDDVYVQKLVLANTTAV